MKIIITVSIVGSQYNADHEAILSTLFSVHMSKPVSYDFMGAPFTKPLAKVNALCSFVSKKRRTIWNSIESVCNEQVGR